MYNQKIVQARSIDPSSLFSLSFSLTEIHVMKFYQVFKRPGLDKFLRDLAKDFEVVVFTAAVPLYAKPVLDLTDKQGYITHRLYRSSTVTFKVVVEINS